MTTLPLRILIPVMLALALLPPSGALGQGEPRRYRPGELTVGQHVITDPSAMKKWIPCTITKVNYAVSQPGEIDTYSVRCGGSVEYSIIADTDHIKPGGSGAPAAVGARSVAAAPGAEAQHPYARHQGPMTSVVQAAGRTLRDGTYHCIVGYSTMLTYGDFRIAGNHYTFIPGNGNAAEGGSGTYRVNADRSITWFGDVGVINRPPAHVSKSALDGVVKDSFWFEFATAPGRVPETNSCRRV